VSPLTARSRRRTGTKRSPQSLWYTAAANRTKTEPTGLAGARRCQQLEPARGKAYGKEIATSLPERGGCVVPALQV
jgi:hypothetical protein